MENTFPSVIFGRRLHRKQSHHAYPTAMKHNTGQVLPFCLLLIVALLILVISNFEIGFLQLKKIENQKKLDGIALHYATDYARGLNALAGINEALVIARNRGYMMASVYTALAGCTLFGGACARQFSNLSMEIYPFYRKLNKLGKDLALQQEQIIAWMLQSRCQSNMEALTLFKNYHYFPELPCVYRPDYSGLPFYRPDEKFGKQVAGVEDCQMQRIHSYEQFQAYVEKLSSQSVEDGSVRLKIKFTSVQQTIHFEKPLTLDIAKKLPRSMQKKITDHYENFIFREAMIHHCKKFTQLFEKLTKGFPFVFEIPSPLVLKSIYFQRDHKMAFMASGSVQSPIETIRTKDQLGKHHEKIWSVTEISIDGDDFQKMEFKPRLDSITLQNELYMDAIQKKPYIRWPNLIGSKDEFFH